MNEIDCRLFAAWLQRQPDEAVQVLPRLTEDESGALLATLDTPALAALMRHASPWWLKRAVQAHPNLAWREALDRADADPNAVRLLRLMDRQGRESLLAGVSRRRQGRIMRALALPREQVISIADDRIPVGRADEDVRAVAERYRDNHVQGSWLYLVSDSGTYQGQIALSRLLEGNGTTPLSALPRTRFEPLRGGMLLTDALRRDDWKSTDTLPVADADGVLIGAARFAALARALELSNGDPPQAQPSLPALLMSAWLDVLAVMFVRGRRP